MFNLKLNRNKFASIFKDDARLKMKQMFRGKRLASLLSIMLLMFSQMSQAQCAMCRAVLESEENIAIAEGVNNGIVYLMAIPYILVGILFYFVYRKMTS